MARLASNINIMNLMADTTGTAAATTETPGVVDMAGWGGCAFLVISATTGYEAATDFFAKEAATTAATFLSLEVGGAVVASAAADSTSRRCLVLDVGKPNDRYLQGGMTSGTIGDIEAVFAIQYNPLEAETAPTTATPLYNPVQPGSRVIVASPTTA